MRCVILVTKVIKFESGIITTQANIAFAGGNKHLK
jgi:hypothetical protein